VNAGVHDVASVCESENGRLADTGACWVTSTTAMPQRQVAMGEPGPLPVSRPVISWLYRLLDVAGPTITKAELSSR
jgi:hypothetical protein